MNIRDAKALQTASLETPTELGSNVVRDVSVALNVLLADMFALYVKTKNFHWHMSGRHFRDYHLLLDEQAEQIFATTDALAERVRKIGGRTLRSIGHIGRLQRVLDNDADFVTPLDNRAAHRCYPSAASRGERTSVRGSICRSPLRPRQSVISERPVKLSSSRGSPATRATDPNVNLI
jgi:Ferritin-like domain